MAPPKAAALLAEVRSLHPDWWYRCDGAAVVIATDEEAAMAMGTVVYVLQGSIGSCGFSGMIDRFVGFGYLPHPSRLSFLNVVLMLDPSGEDIDVAMILLTGLATYVV